MRKDKLAKNADITISTLLHNFYDNWMEGITGLFSLERKDATLTLGHLVQRARNGHRLKSIMNTWDKLVEQGQIKEGYEDSDQNYSLLQELLNALDDDLLNEDRFELLRKIYFVTATEMVEDRDSVLPYQLMLIGRTLNSGEVVVLFTVHRLVAKHGSPLARSNNVQDWINRIAKESGMEFPQLAESFVASLVEKGLLTGRTAVGSYISEGSDIDRLTRLGKKFCDYVIYYDTELSEKED